MKRNEYYDQTKTYEPGPEDDPFDDEEEPEDPLDDPIYDDDKWREVMVHG